MNWPIAVAVFLLLHGLVHVAIYPPPPNDEAPFQPHRSWLLRRYGVPETAQRAVAVAGSVISAVAFVTASGALLAGAGWWAPVAAAAAGVSLALLAVYYHPWLTFGLLLDLAVISLVFYGPTRL
ncbi:hypothetical protein [Longispora urticae]